ncbi:MAG: T9SS type A sorting domain-containing protein [Bacteroidota bacterium]
MKRILCLLLLVIPLAVSAGEFEKNTGQIRYANGEAANDVFYRLRTKTADWYFTASGFSVVAKSTNAAEGTTTLKRSDIHFLNGQTGIPQKQQQHSAANTQTLIYKNLWPSVDLSFTVIADSIVVRFNNHANSSIPNNTEKFGFEFNKNRMDYGISKNILSVAFDMEFKQKLIDQNKQTSGINRSMSERCSGSICYYQHRIQSVSWTTYCGGFDADELYGEAICPNGDLIVSGRTQSMDFPVDTNAVQVTNAGSYDAVVARIKPDGTKRWCTYLGGSGFDGSWSAAMIGEDAVICGNTNSANFPMLNAAQPAIGGSFDAFVARFDSAGSLIWSTFYGGSLAEQGLAIATDASGNIYLGGSANSPNLPAVSGGWQTAPGGMLDGFVARLTSTGAPVWATFCGGTATEDIHDITTGPGGLIAACGETYSNNFPTTANAFQTGITGLNDAYLLVMDSSGNRVYNTCLGGFSNEDANGVRFDAAGNIYVAGFTQSIDFPVTGAQFQNTYNGSSDAFVACFTPNYQLYWATFLGSANNEQALALTVSGKYIYVGGITDSPNFPITTLANQDSIAGSNDGFYCKLDTAGNWVASSFFGGSQLDAIYGIAITADTMAYLVGNTFSNNLPTLPGVWQPTYTSLGDAFVAMRDVSEELSGNAAFDQQIAQPEPAVTIIQAENTLQVQTQHPASRIEIRDAAGRTVLQQNGFGQTQHSISTVLLAKGVYIVCVYESNGAIITQKFLR